MGKCSPTDWWGCAHPCFNHAGRRLSTATFLLDNNVACWASYKSPRLKQVCSYEHCNWLNVKSKRLCGRGHNGRWYWWHRKNNCHWNMSTKTEKYSPKLDSFWTVNTSIYWMKPNWKTYSIKSSDPYSLDSRLQYSEKQARETQSSAWGHHAVTVTGAL